MKYVELNNFQDLYDNVGRYNTSYTEQFVFVDMKLEDLNICLSAVDIVVMIDLPKTREKLQEVESYFQVRVCNHRRWSMRDLTILLVC